MAEAHVHRIEGTPIKMSPEMAGANIAWRCSCGWWRFTRGVRVWYPPATDHRIRLRWLNRLNGNFEIWENHEN
jgi:hypothetical protein